jgi:hypothetical protein
MSVASAESPANFSSAPDARRSSTATATAKLPTGKFTRKPANKGIIVCQQKHRLLKNKSASNNPYFFLIFL